MKLTQEQLAIINSTGNIKINAVAGSGKTTTIIEYAKARPGSSKILYLAFNKSVKMEAIKKFAEKGLDNVKVETAHSLAYRNIVFRHKYEVRPQGYKTYEIAELLRLKGSGEKHAEYVLANHINKFVAYFCNSDKPKVHDLNYLDVVFGMEAISFVTLYYDYIEQQTRRFLSKMDNGEIQITHDFYLKKFQLSNPKLPFDYILFDEGQDASPAMLDVFLKQRATKVIVGDTHQQIYSWRFAVNSLELARFKTFQLSTSFRFSQDIAKLAMAILEWKNHLTECGPFQITGNGESKTVKSKAVVARTNLGLLLKAIEFITEKKRVRHIYFEGNIASYTYADEGTSLYDVLNLYNGKRTLIRDSLLREMKDMDELEDYIEKTEDVQLGMMVEIVKEYENEIPNLIKTLKEMQVENDQKDKAEMIFSTVHKCKGMEYDEVHIVEDFITEEKLEKTNLKTEEEVNLARLNEEINLLYVAATRTRNHIYIPDKLIPRSIAPTSQIHREKTSSADETEHKKAFASWIDEDITTARNAFGAQAIVEKANRSKFTGAYKRWTDELDDELTVMYCEGYDIRDLAVRFGRSKGAIWSRIKKLDLERLYG
jgi:superfamily I DNA/RNA helicase